VIDLAHTLGPNGVGGGSEKSVQATLLEQTGCAWPKAFTP